eukprot:scaffold285_cov330-Pavlova_lutheri.AAC.103
MSSTTSRSSRESSRHTTLSCLITSRSACTTSSLYRSIDLGSTYTSFPSSLLPSTSPSPLEPSRTARHARPCTTAGLPPRLAASISAFLLLSWAIRFLSRARRSSGRDTSRTWSPSETSMADAMRAASASRVANPTRGSAKASRRTPRFAMAPTARLARAAAANTDAVAAMEEDVSACRTLRRRNEDVHSSVRASSRRRRSLEARQRRCACKVSFPRACASTREAVGDVDAAMRAPAEVLACLATAKATSRHWRTSKEDVDALACASEARHGVGRTSWRTCGALCVLSCLHGAFRTAGAHRDKTSTCVHATRRNASVHRLPPTWRNVVLFLPVSNGIDGPSNPKAIGTEPGSGSLWNPNDPRGGMARPRSETKGASNTVGGHGEAKERTKTRFRGHAGRKQERTWILGDRCPAKGDPQSRSSGDRRRGAMKEKGSIENVANGKGVNVTLLAKRDWPERESGD